jgi:hypothetical protein
MLNEDPQYRQAASQVVRRGQDSRLSKQGGLQTPAAYLIFVQKSV